MTQCQQTHETLIKEIFCGLDDESQTDVFKEKRVVHVSLLVQKVGEKNGK